MGAHTEGMQLWDGERILFKVGDRDVRKELLSETNRLLMGNDCKKTPSWARLLEYTPTNETTGGVKYQFYVINGA